MGILLILVACVILADNMKVIFTYKEFDAQQEELISTYIRNESLDSTTVEDDIMGDNFIPDLEIDFEALQKINPDIIGWIYIPGTKTNYPILLGDDNNEYLHKNYKNEYQYMGSIFAHCETSPLLDNPYTVLFGHNMRSGRMFGDLSNYSDNKFREQYPYVYIYTPKECMRCTVFSAGYVSSKDSDIYSYGYGYETETFGALINKIIQNSLYDCNIEVTEKDQIFCLSTCTDNRLKTERFVVHCVVNR